MSHIERFLADSRLAGIIEAVEKGERVDAKRALTLQALDIARLGEMYALDVIEAEAEADERFKRSLSTGQESPVRGVGEGRAVETPRGP